MDDIASYREILEHVQKQFKESYVTSDKYKLEFDVSSKLLVCRLIMGRNANQFLCLIIIY